MFSTLVTNKAHCFATDALTLPPQVKHDIQEGKQFSLSSSPDFFPMP